MRASPKKKPVFQVTTLLAGVMLLMILFITVGYFFTLPVTVSGPVAKMSESELQWARWQELRPTRYEYIVERGCFCTPAYREPYVVRVDRNLRTFSYSRKLEDLNPNLPAKPPNPLSIKDIFVLLVRAETDAATLSVLYNSEFSYPETIRIDWNQSQTDEEQYFVIRDFRTVH